MRKPLNHSDVANFVFGGKSIFTLLNTASGNRFTYKLTRKKNIKPDEEDIIFVKVLSRPDNNSDYTFIGTIFGQKSYRHSKKSPFGADCKSSKAMEWLVSNVKTLHPSVEVWHEGKCGVCGKRLTDPKSIEVGIGPVCRK